MKTRMTLSVVAMLLAVACAPPTAEETSPDGPVSDEPGSGEEDPGIADESGEDPGSSDGPVAANLALTSLTFRQVGRKGDDLLVEVSGTDSLKATSAVVLTFLDASGAPVPAAVDTDWDGEPDAAGKRFHFEASTMGKDAFTGTVLVKGAFLSSIHGVRAALEDEAGGLSASVKADLTVQALRDASAACDPAKIVDRCPAGMSCSGAPATCQPGVAPSLAKAAYVGGANGKMLFKGLDPDEDVTELSIEFLDASNQPVSVSWFEDGPTSSSIPLYPAWSEGTAFLFEGLPSVEFSSQVAKIAATATDAMGFTSTRVISSKSSLPTRTAGQTCDPDGLDVCATGLVCAKALASSPSPTCASASTMRTKKCAAVPALDPTKGVLRAFGRVEGASMWDPPSGCIPALATARPEAAVPLKLPKGAARLVVTTALPETDFDTAVYLLPSCAATSAGALGCNDDEKGFSSTLSLENVPAGDYTIVVESVAARGGHFGVAVTVE